MIVVKLVVIQLWFVNCDAMNILLNVVHSTEYC